MKFENSLEQNRINTQNNIGNNTKFTMHKALCFLLLIILSFFNTFKSKANKITIGVIIIGKNIYTRILPNVMKDAKMKTQI